MKTKILLLFIVLCTFGAVNAQRTSYETWSRILKVTNTEWNTVYETCPNFPKKNENAEAFTKAVTSWNNKYPNEVLALFSLESIQKANPSKYYLGLPLDENKHQYENSFIQWVKESNISDRRLMEVAPNFPDMTLEAQSFNFEFERWQQLYSHEYENLINAEELTRLNPDYEDFIEVVAYPNFMGGLESKEKPVLQENVSKEEKLAYELKLMNWTFVFDHDNFKKIYGFYPEFPEDFNVERYRLGISEKIDETERQLKLGNFETN